MDLSLLAINSYTIFFNIVKDLNLQINIFNSILDNMRWWDRQLSGSEWRNPWLRGNNAEAATAGWGLRAMIAAKLYDQAIPVARYLLSAYHPDDLDPDVVIFPWTVYKNNLSHILK